jgi:iron complex outermembrane receptor protein
MPKTMLRFSLLAPLAAHSALCFCAEPEQALAPIVVTATRTPQSSFDVPAAIDRVPRAAIRNDEPMVNLSESLSGVPGIVAQNRQNYAQDLQISSRGFGARSSFGVRGLRLYVDGIPATMPDGQGQVSHIDLGSADHIEVLRGPFSTLYGNSSGGVIAVFTENGKPGAALQTDLEAGSYGTERLGLKASGQESALNYVVSGSRFLTDGYREHSAANRNTGNAKLKFSIDEFSSLTLIGNAVQMHDVQDPLGLSRAQFDADPRGADPSAVLFNTRKSVDQQQGGLAYERALGGGDNVQAMLYAGHRATVQYQSIPVAVQAAPTHPGGVIDLAREYSGMDLRWTHRTQLAGMPLHWTAGVAFDQLDEDRRGFENFIGSTLGVEGNLRRNESNRVFNFDQYLQAQWEPADRWLLLAGVRNSTVHVGSVDHYIVAGNGDDSGGVRYHATTPVLGATYRYSERLNLYASYGKGFETPTLNELAYRSTGAVSGLNFALQPAQSNHVEIGAKALVGRHGLATLALFHVDTDKELTVLANTGGRAVYQNAGKTRRDGIELSYRNRWGNGVGFQTAYTWLRAQYSQAFCSGACAPSTLVAAGSRIPGVPRQSWFGELSWRHPPSGFHTGLEARYVGRVYVDDANSDAAPSYTVVDVHAGWEQKLGPWELNEFARIDNLANRQYAGSVIVNESNRRFFEPAPGRNYLAGISLAYRW